VTRREQYDRATRSDKRHFVLTVKSQTFVRNQNSCVMAVTSGRHKTYGLDPRNCASGPSFCCSQATHGDQARRIGANIAKLPELVCKRELWLDRVWCNESRSVSSWLSCRSGCESRRSPPAGLLRRNAYLGLAGAGQEPEKYSLSIVIDQQAKTIG